MLLSSVNFIAKGRTGKKDVKQDKKVVEDLEDSREDVCEMCRKQIEEDSTIFQFPTLSHSGSSNSYKTSGYSSAESLVSEENKGDRVTIATGDELCLSVDQFYYTIGLKEGERTDSTCVFRKQVLDYTEQSNGHIETAVFVLDCDQDFYLTCSKNKSLELNYYPESPKPDTEDERMFLIYYTTLGHVLIQPKHHKNTYLHHIDHALSVQQLDLNWRCPEEYFFHFNAVPEDTYRQKSKRQITCSHKAMSTDNECENDTDNSSVARRNTKNSFKVKKSEQMKDIPEKCNRVLLPTRKVCKNKHSLKSLFIGCFSGRSNLLSQSEV
ncbi:hypothetical protein MAR_013180 [Mya arenaria]|uniref:Uncharacterized protein n=1 Tax=Mya arenaria TaxID=6604 RepID=A0ABY7G886_MYAAR|nr:uncharacterized protein LOC128218777 [Mya arenaria]WAR27476.1 hypothetical protein MAR_013180 [Mya arenaria]